MRLTKHTDYAFRVLIYIASMREEKTTIQKLSQALEISNDHLKKVVNKLASTHWIAASRGKNGGIKLGIAPEALKLREVVELMEQTLSPVNCEAPLCKLNPHCHLRGILDNAQQAFMESLDAYTLADLVKAPMPETILAIEVS
ncbi:Rrf2 family transcriptional regulator [uncultured Pseudoteredinibacter sp.]|uniref:Rrf2 family transcriptional regulator n=1 Tax=uncultured Pseudoteredinibacter sp. TaxID=1641701 RepID=UPI00260EDB32|nr:Rrf2 family transcriptional regulator [uncultured Pseudoteredinibacter sp.]